MGGDCKLSTCNASSPDGWRKRKGGYLVQLNRFIRNKDKKYWIAKKYLEYVLSAKTMNAKLYLSEGLWRVGEKEKVGAMGRLPDEVIALAIDLEIACAFQTI
eukprot:scaffold202263_cov54-Attheya_sp.AAC.1